MPTSFEAVAVLFVALLPGALYIWSFERLAGRWGVGLSDRVLRFVGASAIVHSVLAPASYWLWTSKWPSIATGASNPLWLWAIAGTYVVVPLEAPSSIPTLASSSSTRAAASASEPAACSYAGKRSSTLNTSTREED